MKIDLPDENTWSRLNTRMTRRDALSIGGGLVVGAALASAAFLAAPHAGPSTVTETSTVTSAGATGTETSTITITSAGTGVTTTITTTPTVTEIQSTTGSPTGTYITAFAGYAIGFAVPMLASIPDASAMFNCTVKLVGTPDYTYSNYYPALQAAIASKPNGLMTGMSPTVYPYIHAGLSEGVPIISILVDDANSVNSPHPSGRMSYVGTDQYTLSYDLAQQTLPAIQALNPPKGAPIGIFIQRPGAPDLETRAQGYKDILVPAGFTCTEHLAGPDNTDESTSQTEAWLTANPNAIALFGCDGISTPGITNSIKSLGLGGTSPKLVGAGYDLILENLLGIQQGNLYAACNQQPYIQIPQGTMVLKVYNDSGGLIYPWNCFTGASVVNQTNVSTFYNARNSKYVGATTMNPWTPMTSSTSS